MLSEVLNCAGGIVCFEGFLFTSLSKIWQRSELINLDQFPEHSEKDREREREIHKDATYSLTHVWFGGLETIFQKAQKQEEIS